MFNLDLEKAEEPEIKLPTSVGLSKKQESSRKTSTSALLAMPKPLTVWITIKEMGIPDHLTCLLRNLYAGQEATVNTGHGTTDWLQIGAAWSVSRAITPEWLLVWGKVKGGKLTGWEEACWKCLGFR